MDEQIAQRTAAYIKKQAAAKKPLFIYPGFCCTFIHRLGVHPDFAGHVGRRIVLRTC